MILGFKHILLLGHTTLVGHVLSPVVKKYRKDLYLVYNFTNANETF